MSKPKLVIGVNGFLGSHVTRQLVADDAARAMILAAERGRSGERYLISERMITKLGWQPRPVAESIREAARFWMKLRDTSNTAAKNASSNADQKGTSA